MRSRLFAACVVVFGCVTSWATLADDQVKDAAIGGALGGALGGAVGAEVGGKQGAVIGAGVGAAAGAAIATDDGDNHHHHQADVPSTVLIAPAQGRFCPPGQAKKGRC